MAPIIICAKGGKEPAYITANVEDLVGFTAEEIMALPSFKSVSPRLAAVQQQLNLELAKAAGQFHHYSYGGELRHKNGHRVATQNTVLIARTNQDHLIMVAIHPVCHCSLLRKVMELWPRLSEASAKLVCSIVESLAHFAV